MCLQPAFFVFAYSLLMANRCVSASLSLHSAMLLAVLRAPLAFFDTTPIGRIMNRFSRDIDTVDSVLPEIFESWITSAFNVLSTVIILCYATPIFIAIAVPLGVLYFFAQVRVLMTFILLHLNDCFYFSKSSCIFTVIFSVFICLLLLLNAKCVIVVFIFDEYYITL